MDKLLKKVLILLIFVIALSCGKDKDVDNEKTVGKFQWSENISVEQIPNNPITGVMNGKEIKIEYVNYEQWRGSGDNVINIGNRSPKQNCGYVENDDAFHLMNVAGEFKEGEFIKGNFDTNIEGVIADYHYYDANNNIVKVNVPWNCALLITELGDDIVKGKIAICFKDDKKSWIAGTFEAIRCFN